MGEKIDGSGNAVINNIKLGQQTTHPSSPGSGYELLYIMSGSAYGGLYVKDSSGREIGPFITGTSSAGGGGLLAYHSYSPSITVLSTSSTSFVDVDATNMVVTFTVPSSGNVLIRLTAFCDVSASNIIYYWGLRESTSDLAGSGGVITRSIDGNNLSIIIPVTGLTPSASKTYKWSHKVDNAGGVGRIVVGPGQSDFPAAVMEVWSAP